MKLADCYICWTPLADSYPVGMRGKARLFRQAGPDDLRPFVCRAGRNDARAHDPRLERRQTYALAVAMIMTVRDGLDVGDVHGLMLGIDEYASGSCPELVT